MGARDRPAGEQFCLACFTGNYPLPVDPALDKFIMEKREKRAQSAGRGRSASDFVRGFEVEGK